MHVDWLSDFSSWISSGLDAFVKRYLAVMFAGAIMALLFVMMTYYAAAFDVQGVLAFQKDGDLPAYLASLGVSFAGLLTFC